MLSADNAFLEDYKYEAVDELANARRIAIESIYGFEATRGQYIPAENRATGSFI